MISHNRLGAVFKRKAIKMVSDIFPETEKVVTRAAFFMDLIDFYGFQASKLAVIR